MDGLVRIDGPVGRESDQGIARIVGLLDHTIWGQLPGAEVITAPGIHQQSPRAPRLGTHVDTQKLGQL